MWAQHMLTASKVLMHRFLPTGLISSNGVNGSPRTEKSPEGTGIQVCMCALQGHWSGQHLTLHVPLGPPRPKLVLAGCFWPQLCPGRAPGPCLLDWPAIGLAYLCRGVQIMICTSTTLSCDDAASDALPPLCRPPSPAMLSGCLALEWASGSLGVSSVAWPQTFCF